MVPGGGNAKNYKTAECRQGKQMNNKEYIKFMHEFNAADREEILITIAKSEDVSLSLVHQLSEGLSDSASLRLCANIRALPKYMKSKLSP